MSRVATWCLLSVLLYCRAPRTAKSFGLSSPKFFHPSIFSCRTNWEQMARSSKVSSVSVNQDTSMPISSSGASTRSCILQVGVCAGKLCAVANTLTATKKETTADGLSVADLETEDAMVLSMTELMMSLWETSVSLDINLVVAVREKLELNKRKYPVHLCKGKAGKYTEYSKETGVTKSNQSTVGVAGVLETISNSDGTITNPTNNPNNKPITKDTLLAEIPILAEDIRAFATEREWAKYHTPRNLILALLGEVGELAELVQWKGDDHGVTDTNAGEPTAPFDSLEMVQLSQELADVFTYLLRLATVCDLISALCNSLKQQT